MMHCFPHPKAGQEVRTNNERCRVIDWYDRLHGHTWRGPSGAPVGLAEANYAKRAERRGLPLDDNLVCVTGCGTGLPYLVHDREIEPLPLPAPGYTRNPARGQ